MNAKDTQPDGSIIVFVGLMGSGKSTIGANVARNIGADFIDTDEMIARRTQKSVRDLFSSIGEPAFREIESTVLRDALFPTFTGKSVVVATGGGVVLSQLNRMLIIDRARCVVWLDAPVEDLVLRTSNGKNRPLLDGNARVALQEMHESRQHLYSEVATIRIDGHARSVVEVAQQVTDAIKAEILS